MTSRTDDCLGPTDDEAARALRAAHRFLRRWTDAITREHRDDIAQEAAFESWRRRHRLQHPSHIAAYARTVARRIRCQRLMQLAAPVTLSLGDPRLAETALARDERPHCVRIDGEPVPFAWLRTELDAAMDAVGSLNRRILLNYYEGFSCAELAERYGMPEYCVKVRLHRCRRRLRDEFRGRAEVAMGRDDGPSTV